MSLKPGKRDVETILPILDPDWKQLDPDTKADLYEVGMSILTAAWDRYEERGRYYTAIQINSIDGLPVKRTDPRGGSVLLGPYSTAAQAATAASQARVMLGGKYTCLAVVLDTQDATPSVWVKAFVQANEDKGDTGIDPKDMPAKQLIEAHALDRIINPSMCGLTFLDKERNVLGFCGLPHRHEGMCEERIPLPSGVSDPSTITGLTQTIDIKEAHEPDEAQPNP